MREACARIRGEFVNNTNNITTQVAALTGVTSIGGCERLTGTMEGWILRRSTSDFLSFSSLIR
jgi:hypothetical protein